MMDDMKTVALTLILTCLCFATQCSGQCADIDTQACVLMAANNANLCNDPSLSNTACPKFCNKCHLVQSICACPEMAIILGDRKTLVCYHCDSSVRNYKDCNTTRVCQTGEQCLMHQLLSSKDGHQEYKMSCASLDICDGNGIMLLGRRSINARNVITQCCSTDLCNYPSYQQTTTSTMTSMVTTGRPVPFSATSKLATTTNTPHCDRDIEILIEDSKDNSSSPYIIGYLKDLVSQIEIGPQHNQIGVAVYDDDVRKRFDLDSHTNKTGLILAINRIHFHHDDNDIDKGDVIEFLQEKLHVGHHGDRPKYEDVVIILVDHFGHRRSTRFLAIHHEPHHQVDISSISKDVIVINVGAGGKTSVFSALASDASHVIDVPNYSTLATTLPRVLSLLCV